MQPLPGGGWTAGPFLMATGPPLRLFGPPVSRRKQRKLGIERFVPGIGYQKRTELRKVAYSRIEAIEKTAKAEIERTSVEIQTQLLADGLRTEAAKTFLEQIPSAEALMPRLELGEIEKLLN